MRSDKLFEDLTPLFIFNNNEGLNIELYDKFIKIKFGKQEITAFIGRESKSRFFKL